MARPKGRPIELVLARGLLVTMGFGAIAWAFSVAPFFWREAIFTQAAAHIVAGEAFKADALRELDIKFEHSTKFFRSAVLDKVAIVRLRIAENALSAGGPTSDTSSGALDASVRETLTNAPADPFLWLILFWLENDRAEFSPKHLRYLEMSYLLGPNEGWVALKRSRLALSIFPGLTNDLADKSMSEFVGLVRSEFYVEGSEIIAGSARPIYRLLLGRLKDLKESQLRKFAKVLSNKDVDDVEEILGIAPFGQRPWR